VLFDRLYLLYAGRVVFLGAPLEGCTYLTRCMHFVRDSNILVPATTANPADILLDLLNTPANDRGFTVGDFAAEFAVRAGLIAAIEKSMDAATANAKPVVPSPVTIHQFGNAIWVLESRQLLRTSYNTYYVLFIQLGIFAVILGSLYFNSTQNYVLAGQLYKLIDAPGQVLQAQVALIFFNALSRMYEHERRAGACTPAQFLAQYLMHFSVWVLPSQLFFAIALYLCTFQPAPLLPFLFTVGFGILDALTYVAMFVAICTGFYTLSNKSASTTGAVTACAAIRGLFSFFSGFFLAPGDTSWLWRWVFYLSPTFYSYSAIFKINFAGLEGGEQYLQAYGYDSVDPAQRVLILVGMWLAYVLLSWLFLAADAGMLAPQIAAAHGCFAMGRGRDRVTPQVGAEGPSAAEAFVGALPPQTLESDSACTLWAAPQVFGGDGVASH